MSNRVFGMAPGGRMSLDRAANRRDDRKWKPMIGNTRRGWDRNGRPREKKEASDWAKRWKACGLFNQETSHENVIRLVGAERVQPTGPLEGQIGLEVSGNG